MNKRKPPETGSIIKIGKESCKMLNFLGEGAFGEVWLMVPVANPDVPCAVKRIRNDADPDVLKNFRKEFLIQKRVSNENDGHENVIRVMGSKTDHEWHNLVVEYANGGELFDKIEPDVGMPPAWAQFFFRQLITGLKACHEKDVVHRDIKPENLLLTAN
uniref:non-specific serine/threonine protein kinase n=1 Tax=Caenorhabditis japonica TaxID=281687 RepID=A0A8R1I0W2_CAEJA